MDRDEMVGILQALVRTNTSQPGGNEAQLVRYIEERFAPFDAGLDKRVIAHGGTRASLVLRLGPDCPGGLAFVGHLDTVAAGDASKWTYPPFDGIEADGCVHGRGSLDMKAGVTAMVALGLAVLRDGRPLRKPLYLCFTADEEKGGSGALAVRELHWLDRVDGIVVPEPSDNKIAIAEKGTFWLRFSVSGKLAHGSKPEAGVNAVEAAIRLASCVKERLATPLQHDLLGTQTCAVTKLQGGLMTNIIPDSAVVEFDIRTLPAQDHAELTGRVEACMREMEAAFPGAAVRLEKPKDHVSVETKPGHPFVELVRSKVREAGLNDAVCGMTYFTDAGNLIPGTTTPFVIMGPGPEAMAHQVNEAIRIDDMVKARDIYLKLTDAICR